MSNIADQVLDAVDIIVDKKVSELQFNKTIRGRISEIIDESIGKYKIQYQNSYFTAYSSDSNFKYQKNSEVYVEILSNDFEKNALILGTVRRLGSNYITIIEELDKYTTVSNSFDSSEEVSFCSYAGTQNVVLYDIEATENKWELDSDSIKEAAAAADSLKISAKIKNTLDATQRAALGNFGLKVVVEYYNEAELKDIETRSVVTREYLFDVNDMIGQPYKYTVGSDQYTIFNIDAENFIKIESITAFCEGFTSSEEKTNKDIWLSNFQLQFLKQLTEEQLNTTSLSIETPNGNYFSVKSTGDKILKADLRIKGKKVNYDAQQIDFYWFRKNTRVTTSHENFSPYGGNGWELLNTSSINAYLYALKIDLCPAAETEFKCVAVFNDNGQRVSISDTIVFKNKQSEIDLKIASSAGTVFAFSIGKTTLTLTGIPENSTYTYHWTRSVDNGAAAAVTVDTTSNKLDVAIDTPAATTLKYECSVYDGEVLIGTAAIVLLNTKDTLGYTLVINNGTQIFKYDTYGVSPASDVLAIADRMVIPALSFTIYDRQGQPIEIADTDKIKYMTIKWVWPTEVDGSIALESARTWKNTMLEVKKDRLVDDSIVNIATGISEPRYVIKNEPTLTYGIKNNYDPVLANTNDNRNNIRLEVDYQGEHLTASTNFTFTKEGELGTNGTKYTARIVPKPGIKEIFIVGNNIYVAKYKNNVESTDSIEFENHGTELSDIENYLEAQLWDNTEKVTDIKVTWSIASSTNRAGKPCLTIPEKNVIIDTNGTCNSNIIQATIKHNSSGLKYYATHPIIYTSSLVDGNKILVLDGGYSEVMYESDGTRGRFNGLPFIPKWLTQNGLTDLETSLPPDNLTSSWEGVKKLVENSFNQFIIEPPSYYIAESSGNYIEVQYNDVTTYVPIEFYLNRYGMSAMNDWDGNSIQISDNGGYILSPQVGAGHKENDNSFTGITIGEVFQDQNNKETGMFGYYKGQRSLFLDATNGNAEFGVASEGQIKIRASDGQGTISDGHYHFNHNNSQDPIPGRGLKIKFTSTKKDDKDPNDELGPYIKYGSGNFMVDAAGNLTAQGGGKIAGWAITDTYLQSSDGKTTLYAGEKDTTESNELRFDINDKFKVYQDGRFSAANSKFSVTSNGTITATAGTIGGWKISDHKLSANNNKLILNDNGSLYGPEVNKKQGKYIYSFSPNNRVWEITDGGVAYFTDVKIKNANAAAHGNEEYDGNNFTWYGKNTKDGVTTYPKIFELTDTGSNIGGWNITNNTLKSEGVTLTSGVSNTDDKNTILNVNNALEIYGNGDLSSGGSASFSGTANFSGGGSIAGLNFDENGMTAGSYKFTKLGILYGENNYLQAMETNFIDAITSIEVSGETDSASDSLSVSLDGKSCSVSGGHDFLTSVTVKLNYHYYKRSLMIGTSIKGSDNLYVEDST